MNWIGEDGIIAGSIIGLYGIFRTLKYYNVSFFKNGKGKKEEPVGCPDPDCSAKVKSTADNLEELREDFKDFRDDVYPKIHKTAETLAGLDGFIRGKFQ